MKQIIKFAGNVTSEHGFTVDVCKDIVYTLSKTTSNFLMEYNQKIVDAKSILGLMSLSVPKRGYVTLHGEIRIEEVDMINFLLKKYVDVSSKSNVNMEE